MAESDGQEKTEEATGKKLDDARNEGNVAKSMELNSFAIFTSGLFCSILANSLLVANFPQWQNSFLDH